VPELAGRDFLLLSVRDTGSGMTEHVLRSAVEPFFTTKPVGKGSGLGLSQVYGMVQQSEGFLRLESRVGTGTAVHLYLPRAGTAPSAAEIPEHAARWAESGGRVLVVDDDAGVREITAQMLRQAGYGVTEAESGRMALDALARGETYDVVVIDIAMPGLNGIETIRQARRRWPALRALYVTGYADAGGTDLATGDDLLLKKPFRLRELTHAVAEAIRRPAPAAGKVVRLRRRS
jgi:CheY-like chemotaxis protein